MPVLRELHWLPITKLVNFKVACLARQSLSGQHLSTWQMIAASCLTVLGALCGQLTSKLVLYHEHTAAMATELLHPVDLICRTLYWSSCAIQTSSTDCLGDSRRDTSLEGYLRNNPAVSWPGIEPATQKSWIRCHNQYITEPPWVWEEGKGGRQKRCFFCGHGLDMLWVGITYCGGCWRVWGKGHLLAGHTGAACTVDQIIAVMRVHVHVVLIYCHYYSALNVLSKIDFTKFLKFSQHCFLYNMLLCYAT